MTDQAKTLAPAVAPAGETRRRLTGVRPPTVLQVVPSLGSGGVERGAADIAVALAAAGGKAIVASAGGPMVRELERAGVTHVVLPVDSKNPFVMMRNVDRLARLIEDSGAEIVHARSRAPAWSAYYAARRTERRFVTTFHGTYDHKSPLKRRYNAIMTRGDAVIAISHFIAEHLRAVYGVEGPHVRVIHRGVDLDVFSPGRVAAERLIELSHRWRLPDGMPVVMLPGRLTSWKGQRLLIEALARLGRDDIRCLLVGDDQGRARYRASLEALIEKRDLAGVVQIAGHCRDMAAAYMLADVVVSASTKPEAFGRVAAEAQAMGRPVIASDQGASRETVIPEETGILFPPGDADALANAIDHVLSLTGAVREEVAERAMAHIRANFTKEKMCAETLALYDELAGRVPGALPLPGAA
ncbi:MAG: glycosyltransferase family 4 protein [Alphaproteobacteria bacterium]